MRRELPRKVRVPPSSTSLRTVGDGRPIERFLAPTPGKPLAVSDLMQSGHSPGI